MDRSKRYESATDVLEDLELLRKGEAPHFARPNVDLTQLAVKLGNPQPGQPVAPANAGTKADNSTLTMISIAANIVLLILLLVLVVAWAA